MILTRFRQRQRLYNSVLQMKGLINCRVNELETYLCHFLEFKMLSAGGAEMQLPQLCQSQQR